MPNEPSKRPKLSETVARNVLRPLIGILIRCGMSFSEFSRIARTLYVDVARKEFGKNGRPANKSRIAVLTGLSRTRVRQELETTESDASPDDNTAKVRPASRVLMGWHTDADFTSKAGRARELTGEEFGDLYERYSGKVVPVTAMLKELLSVGAVKMTATGKLRVLARSFTPQQTDSDALIRVSMAIRDLAETASHNLYSEPDQDRRFERFATNQLVPAAHFDEFQQFVAHEGQLFLERIDDWMAAKEDGASKDAIRIGVGVYQIAPRENS